VSALILGRIADDVDIARWWAIAAFVASSRTASRVSKYFDDGCGKVDLLRMSRFATCAVLRVNLISSVMFDVDSIVYSNKPE